MSQMHPYTMCVRRERERETQCEAKNGEVELLLLASVGWLRILKTGTNHGCEFCGAGSGIKHLGRNTRFETD